MKTVTDIQKQAQIDAMNRRLSGHQMYVYLWYFGILSAQIYCLNVDVSIRFSLTRFYYHIP